MYLSTISLLVREGQLSSSELGSLQSFLGKDHYPYSSSKRRYSSRRSSPRGLRSKATRRPGPGGRSSSFLRSLRHPLVRRRPSGSPKPQLPEL